MLYRMTLLRRPWQWDLIAVLGDPADPSAAAETTAQRLRQTSLLEQVDLFVQVSKGQYGVRRHYTLHPATA